MKLDKKNIDRQSKKELMEIIERLEEENSNLKKKIEQENKKFHRNIFDISMIGLVRSRISDGLILDINQKAAELFGLPVDEIVGKKHATDIFKFPEERAKFLSGLKTEKIIGDFETKIIDKNGKELYVSLSAKAYPDKDYIEGVIVDVTDLIKAREEAENLADIIRQSSESIVLTNSNAEIEYVNPIFEEITGYTFEEAKGKNPRILQSKNNPHGREFYKNMWDTLLKGEIWKGEFVNVKKNGDEYLEEATIFPFWDKNRERITGYGAIKKDITQKRKMDVTLRESYNSMRELKQRAESANKMKSRFLANMSHDIRTPLNAIMGFTDLISKLENKDETKQYLKKINNAGRDLLLLINDILDLSKIEANEMKIFTKTFSIREFIECIKDLFELQFLEKELRFELKTSPDLPDYVYIDELRLKQVLMNLLSNALKFTQKGKVVLSTDYEKNGDLIVFKVRDTGVGITPENLKKVFEPFIQVDVYEDNSKQGAGLGLAISNKLISLMGGNIKASSVYGEGTEFIITIPANTAYVDAGTISDTEFKANKSFLNNRIDNKILIVDDIKVNLELISEQLKSEGFNNILTAVNGLEAVNLALVHSPDLILMDVQMPVMDGYEAIKKLRGEGYKGNIIVLSAYAMSEDIEKIMSVGATDYITKPIDFNSFFDKINVYLSDKPVKETVSLSLSEGPTEHEEVNNLKFLIKESVSDRMKSIFLVDIQNKLKSIIEVLNNNISEETREQLRVIAHGYLGNADYFGLSGLTSLSAKIEDAVKQEKSDGEILILSGELKEMLENIYEYNKLL